MLNIGPAEVLVIALIALIVVGPEQLPGLLRKIGKSAGQLRHMADGLKKDFMSGMEELDPNTWTEEKPRGKGTTTDPIIGPGAYGAIPKSENITEIEGESTGQLAEEKAAKDDAAARASQPVTEPVEPVEPASESVPQDTAEPIEVDEGDQQ